MKCEEAVFNVARDFLELPEHREVMDGPLRSVVLPRANRQGSSRTLALSRTRRDDGVGAIVETRTRTGSAGAAETVAANRCRRP
jgi:hypothetical protein